ncbi:hypothetical protein VQ056_24585 [Paenibacillus sp. JTLBN-2024]
MVSLQRVLDHLGCMALTLSELLELHRVAFFLSQQLLVSLRSLLGLLNQLLDELE